MDTGQSCRVLFVEDEAAVSLLIEDMLLDLGVEVVGPAATIGAAMTLAQGAELDAAVLDLNVGGAMTFPVADLLLERGTPLIFATGYDPSVVPQRFRSTPLLQKPFSMSAFEDVLRAALADTPCEIPDKSP